MMRTTVTLDDDVLARLQQESRTREASFRGTLNDVLRDGLDVAERRRESPKGFRVKPRSIGLKPGLSYDSISSLLVIGEGEDHR